MEIRVDKGRGDEIAEKRVCMGKVSNGGDEELRRKRKSKKEAALSSFEPEVKRSRSGFANNGESSSLNGESLGLNGILINLDGRDKVIRIPKKPRGYVGSKSHVSKPSGLSSSLDQIGKLKSEFDGSRAIRVTKSKLDKIEKKDDPSVVENGNVVGGESFAKKGKRKHQKKIKDLGSDGFSVTNLVKAEVDDIRSVSDDEENLEQNAARMLSSRFDPRCTGPSSNSKCPLIRTGRDIGNHLENLQDGLVSPRNDSSNRALRPRNDFKAKGTSRKRRHFYEVAYRDEDAQQFLNQRIKVFWPLDKIWYYGLVNCYDEKTKRHHVKYDDRDMEWICLQNERFKILLLPSEVKDEKSKKSVSCGKPKDRTKTDLSITDANTKIGVYTDSEPISSWLDRSFGRSKSSSGLKKQKTSHVSPSVVPPLSNETGNAQGNENVGSREIDTGEVCILPSTGSLADAREEGKSVFKSTSCKEKGSPVVYFRKRFHKKEISCSVSVHRNKNKSQPRCVVSVADTLGISFDCMDPDKLLWSVGNDGMLKLNMDLIQFKELKTYLSLRLRPFIDYIFGVECFTLFRLSLMLQYGKIMSTWSKVNLEMLLVNNVVGLRFFLFEGCLKQALDFVFRIFTLFREPNEPQKFVDQEIPVTSIRFKLNCVEDHRKKQVFAFYSFSKPKCSDWSYLDSMFEQHCLFSKQLSPTECTSEKIKALECGMKNIHFNSIGWEASFQGLRNKSFQGAMPIGVSKSCNGNRRQFANFGKKHGMFLPFAISFSAAPTLFFNLHLKLLMESCTACIHLRLHSSDCSLDHIENTCTLVTDDCALVECCCENGSQVTSERTNGTSLPDGSGRFCCSNPQLGTEAATLNMDGYNINSSQYLKNQNLEVAETYTCSSDSRISRTDVGKSQECGHDDPELERVVTLRQPLVSKDHASPIISGARGDCYLNDISVEIPAFDLAESKKSPSIQRAPEFCLDLSDGIICSPNPTGPKSLWPHNGINSRSSLGDISPFSPDEKTKIIHYGFGNGPRKSRTQVQYALPSKDSELSSKHKAHNQNGHPYRRIRRSSEKRTSDASKSSQRNLDSLACDANLLVTLGDKGWREFGAQVVLELADHNECRLAVKISGSTKYSHKVHNNLQPGSTNRYTHAMMWKGGKDWALEFPDRSQWVIFKEMHEECYNKNIRAASVKNIPIPGVRLIEEFDNISAVSRFSRCSPSYFRQLENDVEMAMNPTKILYDMDSEDEQWILVNKKSFQAQECTREVITDELFEKTMDMFEKVANARQSVQFTFDEIENIVPGILPMEVTKVIFHHWQQKRQRTGIPLIRHLQRPAWERYQQKMKEWDESMTKANTFAAHGGLAKAPPKPTIFAFCLKPRGLEVLNNNKGSKHRSQRRYHVAGNGHCTLGVQDGFRAFGRRLNSFTYGDDTTLFPANSLEYLDTFPRLHASTGMYSPENATGPGYLSLNYDVSDWNIRPKHHKKKSKKLATFLPWNNQHMASRTISKRNGVQPWNFGSSACPTPNHQQSDVFHTHSIEQLSEQDLEEFRLRDASGAAKHASNIARIKRDRARRLLYRSDIVIHKAVSALMIADAVKASYADLCGSQTQGNKSMSKCSSQYPPL